jgi:hypothetical protein
MSAQQNKEFFQPATLLKDEDDEINLDSSRGKINQNHHTSSSEGENNKNEDGDPNESSIDVQLTIQQGSFLPAICLVGRGLIDPTTYIVDH